MISPISAMLNLGWKGEKPCGFREIQRYNLHAGQVATLAWEIPAPCKLYCVVVDAPEDVHVTSLLVSGHQILCPSTPAAPASVPASRLKELQLDQVLFADTWVKLTLARDTALEEPEALKQRIQRKEFELALDRLELAVKNGQCSIGFALAQAFIQGAQARPELDK